MLCTCLAHKEEETPWLICCIRKPPMTSGPGKQRSRVLAALDGTGLFPDASDTLVPPVGTQVLGKRSFENIGAAQPSSSNIRGHASVAPGPGSSLSRLKISGWFSFCCLLPVDYLTHRRWSCRAGQIEKQERFAEATLFGSTFKTCRIRVRFEI